VRLDVSGSGKHIADVASGATSILRGLLVTLRNAFRPRVTRDYPARPTKLAPRFRGQLVHRRGEDNRPKCTACLVCRQVCPTNAICEIEGDEKKGKERRATAYAWDASRCLFCNLCVEACSFKAIRMGQEYRMVGESREDMCLGLAELLEECEGEGT
jgi:NADH-quinone oxidoreductase subunit I